MIMLGTTKPKFDSHLVFHVCLLQFVKMSEKGRIIIRLSVFGRPNSTWKRKITETQEPPTFSKGACYLFACIEDFQRLLN